MDMLEKSFSSVEGFRLNLLPVEASVPRPEPEEQKESDKRGSVSEEKRPLRISREELYSEISDTAKLSCVYIAMVFLATVVAAIGLLRDNVAVLIGAMVVAPLLGPNVGLSLATTLGDSELALRALKANFTGILVALIFSFLMGCIFHVDPDIPEIFTRTMVGVSDIFLAFAAGCAGALAFTTGVSAALIGVMVAVALLPPLVASGLLLGAGYAALALGAAMLFLTNVICVNLAGVMTFLIQGIRPNRWWEANKAKRATRQAIILWSSLLVVLGILIFISQKN
jgi:uncharacterized hydrophobic protein (TIGR00341 family)